MPVLASPACLRTTIYAACGGGPATPESLPGPFSGTTDIQTTSFALKGGDYIVDWTATDPGNGSSCFFGVLLKEDSGTGFEDVVDAEPAGGETKRGTANLHDIAAGTWYFSVISHCTWTLTIRH